MGEADAIGGSNIQESKAKEERKKRETVVYIAPYGSSVAYRPPVTDRIIRD